jgi:hypothetical protein
VKDRRWYRKKYKQCFVGESPEHFLVTFLFGFVLILLSKGSEAVDWLVKTVPSWSRQTAVQFGTDIHI